MSALSGVVNKCLHFQLFNVTFARQYLPFLFFAVSLGGSLLKELDVVPNTYFSNRRNILNVYFVKFSWGWNLFLLLPFIYLSNYYKGNLVFLSKRLASLVVATAVWYFCTLLFFHIENATGACYDPDDHTHTIKDGFGTKAACKTAGFSWEGFDISGHCFILSYSTLIIVEEMVPMLYISKHYKNRTAFLDVLYLALNAIALVWIWMFACTSVYFHNAIQKFLGTSVGVLVWCLTYKYWYAKPFSPGLPLHQSDDKQHD